jgi:hypothetical protein
MDNRPTPPKNKTWNLITYLSFNDKARVALAFFMARNQQPTHRLHAHPFHTVSLAFNLITNKIE